MAIKNRIFCSSGFYVILTLKLCKSCRFCGYQPQVDNNKLYKFCQGFAVEKNSFAGGLPSFFLRVGLCPTRRHRVRPVGEHIGSREPAKKEGRRRKSRRAPPTKKQGRREFSQGEEGAGNVMGFGAVSGKRRRVSGFDGTRQAETGTATQTNESAPAGRSETATAAATEDTGGQ